MMKEMVGEVCKTRGSAPRGSLATKFFVSNKISSKHILNLYNLIMNFFQLIYAYIKKNLKTAQETEDSDERKKQWIKIVFGIVLALGYGGLHVPPNVSMRKLFML